MKHRHNLPNGCKCSDIKVHPDNWNTSKNAIDKDWRLHYKFYDPALGKEKQIIIKKALII